MSGSYAEPYCHPDHLVIDVAMQWLEKDTKVKPFSHGGLQRDNADPVLGESAGAGAGAATCIHIPLIALAMDLSLGCAASCRRYCWWDAACVLSGSHPPLPLPPPAWLPGMQRPSSGAPTG